MTTGWYCASTTGKSLQAGVWNVWKNKIWQTDLTGHACNSTHPSHSSVCGCHPKHGNGKIKILPCLESQREGRQPATPFPVSNLGVKRPWDQQVLKWKQQWHVNSPFNFGTKSTELTYYIQLLPHKPGGRWGRFPVCYSFP